MAHQQGGFKNTTNHKNIFEKGKNQCPTLFTKGFREKTLPCHFSLSFFLIAFFGRFFA
jgi:hypothetical protein